MDLIKKINWENKRILIIGEASIDKYIMGSANQISPDAPVPNIKVEESLNYIGGVGLALRYINSLGGIPEVCTIIGNDFEGDFFLKEIKKLNIDTSGILVDDNNHTPQITRIKAMNQQVLRLETDYSSNFSDLIIQKYFKNITSKSSEIDSILILNYGIDEYTYVISEELAWLSVNPMSGGPVPPTDTLTVSVDINDLVDGIYEGNFSENLEVSKTLSQHPLERPPR